MAAKFRKMGITTLGACAGLGLAGWALNPFDKQYAVRSTPGLFITNQNTLTLTFTDDQNVNAAAIATPRVKRKLPPRSEQVKTLQSGEEYDVIIVGGGATGAGCALDAITRGIFRFINSVI